MDGLPRIEAIYAWIVKDKDNTEGVPLIGLPVLGGNLEIPAPMYTYQEGAQKKFNDMAQEVANEAGLIVMRAKFSNRVDEQRWTPRQPWNN